MSIRALSLPALLILLAGDAISGIAVFQKKASAEWKHAGYFPGTPKQVWFFAEDKEGTIWGGTQDEVVYRLNPVLDKDGNIDLEKSHAETNGWITAPLPGW